MRINKNSNRIIGFWKLFDSFQRLHYLVFELLVFLIIEFGFPSNSLKLNLLQKHIIIFLGVDPDKSWASFTALIHPFWPEMTPRVLFTNRQVESLFLLTCAWNSCFLSILVPKRRTSFFTTIGWFKFPPDFLFLEALNRMRMIQRCLRLLFHYFILWIDM